MNSNTLQFNPILATDSYKASHYKGYPTDVVGMFSYIEARTNGEDTIVPFGLQMWIQKFLSVPITTAHVDEAEAFFNAHGEPFNREGWDYMVSAYGGFMPLNIRAVPEGMPVPSGNAIVTIECIDPKVFWLSSYLETALQRGVWYPTTIASNDYAIKKDIVEIYKRHGGDLAMVPFSYHDFGGRGVTCAEQAEIGGAAHLVNFMGSDTVEGIRAANFYYDDPMAAFSVPATEHSIECSFGASDEGELNYLNHVLDNMAKPGGIVSIVIDGYDMYRAVETLCTTLKDKIIACGAKVVFRPDSGDPHVTVPHILRAQEKAFGYTLNSAGKKKINHVGILQGDGVDHGLIRSLLGRIVVDGYSPDCMVFGSGGALLQKVNRDTYKFAQKASAIKIRDQGWYGIAKNPVTDPGKKSKIGLLTCVRNVHTNEISTIEISDMRISSHEDLMRTVYQNGVQHYKTTLAEIRKRCAIE